MERHHRKRTTAIKLTKRRTKKRDTGGSLGRRRWTVAGIAALLSLGAFAVSGNANAAAEGAFYVGSHGWHTSIVVPRAQIPANAWPRGVTTKTFAHFKYLELGWGDRKFYTAPKPNIAMAFDAVFLPGPSVLHVVGLNPPLERALPWSALIRVPCTGPEFTSLCLALGDTFERDQREQARPLGPGLYGETSRFYPARGRYHLLNTCDTWTVRMMRAGGLAADCSPAETWSAGTVIAQARRLTTRSRRNDGY